MPLGGAFAAGVKILTKRIVEVEKFAAVVEVCRCSKFAAGVGGLISILRSTYNLVISALSSY